jgi:uncharacterized protein (TIGR02145 family)
MKKTIFLGFLAIWCGLSSLSAQVTIGADNAPQSFSVLELISGNDKGLRLPQLTTAQRDAITTAAFKAEPLALGLLIQNTTTKCIEYWNLTKWVSLCTGTANISFEDGSGDPADPTQPEFPYIGEERGPFTPTDEPPCTGIDPAYSFLVVSGAAYLHVSVLNTATGEFRVSMDENNSVNSRTAILRITNNCSNEYKEFVFSQAGDPTLCEPSANAPVINAPNGVVLCAGGVVYLELTNPTPAVDYIWTLGGVEKGRGASYIATQKGTYTVYAGGIGCTVPVAASIDVTLSTASAPSPISLIVGQNGGFVCSDADKTRIYAETPASGSLMWFKNGVHQNSISQTVSGSHTYIEAGIGTWFAAVADGSCSSAKSNEITVSVDPLSGASIPAPVFTINGSAASGIVNVCAGGTLLLDVQSPVGGVTYSWYVNNDKKGEGTHYELSMSGLSGDFIIQCRAANSSQCSSAGVSQLSVSLGSAPSKPVIISNNGSVLCGSSATLSTVSTASKYRWYKDGAFLSETTHPINTYNISELGTYSLQTVNASGCVSELSNGLNISQNSAYGSVEITPQISSIDHNQSRSFTANINPEDAASTYSWTITGATPATAAGKTVLVTFGTVGTAHISVTATNSCTPGGVSATVNGSTGVSVSAACLPVSITGYSPSDKAATIIGSSSTSLTVTPNGNPNNFTYLWYKDGSATAATTQTISVTAAQAGSYTCEVTTKCVPASSVTSDAFTVTVLSIPPTLGSGSLSGKTCFDIVESNFGVDCGEQSGRLSNKADFTHLSTHTQVYTFKKSLTGIVQNVRFVLQDSEGVLSSSQPLSGTLISGTMSVASTTLTLNFKTNLNSQTSIPQIYGRTRVGLSGPDPAVVIVNIVYNNGSTDVYLPLTLSVQDCACCGAFVASGVWKEFMCHNLGANQSADPFTPSADINGDYYQWGYKYPSATRDNILGTPTTADGSAYTGTWNNSSATPGYYGDNTNGTNVTVISPTDPCPSGYRVPSYNEWLGVTNKITANLNPQSSKGPWGTAGPANWSGAMFGNALYLPAAGRRNNSTGSLNFRGAYGYYWSTRINSSTNTYIMYFDNGAAMNFLYRAYGITVRCIAE